MAIETSGPLVGLISNLTPLFSALIGSLITLFGVLQTLKHSEKQNREAIEAENRRQKEERKYVAKRDVIVAANKAAMEFIHFIVHLPEYQFPTGGKAIPEAVKLSVAVSRLHSFCSMETIESMVMLSRRLNDAFEESIRAKLPSIFVSEDISSVNSQISNLEEAKRTLSQEIYILQRNSASNSLIQSYKNELAKIHERLVDLRQKNGELLKQKHLAVEACRDVIQKDIGCIYEAFRKALISGRKELSFDINEERYEQFMKKHTEEALDSTQQLLDYLRDKAKERYGL